MTRLVVGGRRLLHPAWTVAAVALLAIVSAAGFRATPGVLVLPLQEEFGWSVTTISSAVAVNLVLFGLIAPFAAALMERFGMRRVVVSALVLVATGSGATVVMGSPWQLVACWGVLVGIGTGSMALVFAATVAQRWFVTRRGLVVGILTAGSAAGQLVFLPVLSILAQSQGWRAAAVVVSLCALAVVPLVLGLLRERPEDVGFLAYGASPSDPPAVTARSTGGAGRAAVTALRDAARTRAFWALAAGFAICGATTNGLVGTHFIPAAHDHGMQVTAAASLLALIGLLDVVGTIGSGWLTDRCSPWTLLVVYYALRGLSLLALPSVLTASPDARMLLFVLFYGLDWVATVPPTVALCREEFGARGTLVFGWVFASHQVGAGVAALAAGAVRTSSGSYDPAWYAAGLLCLGAAALSFTLRGPAPVLADVPATAVAPAGARP